MNREYLHTLVLALADEIRRVAAWCPAVIELRPDLSKLRRQVDKLEPAAPPTVWQGVLHDYRTLSLQLAAMLNGNAEVSRRYASMDEFWHDARAQTSGESPFTFWDTYEHGRRRQLEQRIAAAYGSEDALLLNAGMSAVAVALDALGLRPGDRILTSKRNYFETAELFDRYLPQRGIEVVRAPIGQPGAMHQAISCHAPKAVFFEVATNSPEVESPADLARWLEETAEVAFVCDNTVQGPLTRWFGDRAVAAVKPSASLLVVESATKYVSQSMVAGLIYGERRMVDSARALARITGQQLQEKAFNYLREGEISAVEQRLKLHSRNVAIFVEALSEVAGALQFLRTLSGAPARACVAPALFANGVGGLLYLKPRTLDEEAAGPACRRIVTEWQRRLAAHGQVLFVRAGFGWAETCARVYESRNLNQADSPAYLRISVGIEPPHIARLLAATLREAIAAVGQEGPSSSRMIENGSCTSSATT
jgi:hypothetical protein